MPETAKRTARVPILGENGRISDDYIPAAIGEGVTKAEAAATRAESAAESAESAKTAAEKARDAAVTAQGGAESAKTAAETAKTAAEKAKADAESAGTAAANSASGAANSAQDAQQSATAAAESAASVADKFITSAVATTLDPGSQATASVDNQVLTIGVPKGDKGDTGEKGDTGTGVPEGGTPGQLLSKTEDGTAWVDPPSGNVLTGTLGPAPILSADDAYATKPRRLTVYGNTVQNLWVNPSGTNNGVTVTSNADGSITLSGTATSAASVSSADSYIIRPSTAYTLSMNAALTGASFVVTEYDAAGSQLTQHNASSASAASFTSSALVARCVMSLSVQSGQAVSGTYRVMLNEGSTAQPWCPPGLNSVDELSVVCAGKNLYGGGDVSSSNYAAITVYPYLSQSLVDQRVRVSFDLTTEGGGTFSVYAYQGSGLSIAMSTVDNPQAGAYIGTEPGVTTHFSATGTVFYRPISGCSLGQIFVYSATHAGYVRVENIQIELGEVETGYEPYQGSTTAIDLDGHTLSSLPDGTCDELTIDATGAVTLTKRVGEAEIPSEASGLSWEAEGSRAYFHLPSATSSVGSDQSGTILCDVVPPRKVNDETYIIANKTNGNAYVKVAGAASAADVADKVGGGTLLYPLATPQTIPLTAVTLPTLPSPNITVYNDSDVPSDITLEYERDVTIAFGKLAKQIAGTASAVAVREASTIEEE